MKDDPKKARADLLRVTIGLALAVGLGIWVANRSPQSGKDDSSGQVAESSEKAPIERELPGAYDGNPRREAPEFTPATELPEIPLEPTEHEIAASRLFGLRLMATESDEKTNAKADNRAVAELLRGLRGLDAEISNSIDRESDPHGFERAYRKEKF